MTVAQRRALPPLLVAAMVIDAIGSGLVTPFILLVGHVLVGLSLPATGVAAAIGSAVDRFGAGRVVVSANLIGAVGDVGLLLSHNALAFAAASAVCALGVRAFWSAFTPLISAIASVEDREKWFGWLRGARYVGLTLGGALASLALLAGEKTGLRIVVAGDAASSPRTASYSRPREYRDRPAHRRRADRCRSPATGPHSPTAATSCSHYSTCSAPCSPPPRYSRYRSTCSTSSRRRPGCPARCTRRCPRRSPSW
jgi:hypothetical protein